jgi:metal-sulfur cluster biosynthetic enzyme
MQIQPDNIDYDQSSKAIEALKRVIDPELFVNIIDLGLVYNIDLSHPDTIEIKMTLSTPHCPLGEAITNGVENVLQDQFPERKAMVNLVWVPQWSLEMMTESGRQQLGID